MRVKHRDVVREDGARNAPRARLLSGPPQVWLAAGALFALTASLVSQHVWSLRAIANGPTIPWWLLVVAFWLAEAFVVHLQFRRDAHSFSLSEIPLVLGLFFADPLTVIVARVLGSALALLAHRRQRPVKLAFNLGHFALGTTVAVILFHAAVRWGDALGPAGWLGAFTGALASDLIATGAITIAIVLTGGGFQRAGFGEVMIVGAFATVTNTGVGLMAVTVLSRDPRSSWLLLLAAVTLFLAYRGYATLRLRQESLESLYTSTQLGRGGTTVHDVIPDLITHARLMFRAERTEIVLSSRARCTAIVCHANGMITTDHVLHDALVTLLADRRGAIVVTSAERDERLAAILRARGVRDLMAAPLYGERGMLGIVVVASRLGDIGTFDDDDLRLFETFANHVAVTIDNAKLIERLRDEAERNQHMALHDALTGLANRTLMRRRIGEVLVAAAKQKTRAAVMIVDLDRFKEVNDTLGHHTGDLLLQQVGGRFVELLDDDGAVARLGGDEFAVVLGGLADDRPARAMAADIRRALEAPFVIDDLTLDIGASIGIAMSPDHGADADTLLQRADVALYLAKDARSGIEVYDPARDRHSPERLALVGELRRAIGGRGLSLAFQPKVDVGRGRIVGAEALVRWHHPERGAISPDELIPLAEHTGLIKPLTGWVLAEAIEACRRWRSRGLDLTVAVNLSARMLRDERLPDQIGSILAAWDVPPSSLVLEITEGSLMEDPDRAIRIIERLHGFGITLSIDDFGTGYSSLAYLKRLPVSELKMDKTFVMGMLEEEGDAVIVRSTIDLGRNLGLRVVAEGVESEEVTDALRALGCDLVQGYHVGRPMPPFEFERFAMRDRPVTVRHDLPDVVVA